MINQRTQQQRQRRAAKAKRQPRSVGRLALPLTVAHPTGVRVLLGVLLLLSSAELKVGMLLGNSRQE